mgnify:CR=1 FL=1
MKNHIIKLSITFILIHSLWAFGGFGMYGNTDMFTATPPATTSGNVTVTPQSMSGANAFGVFAYLDVLPFVDLEADFEFAFSTYDPSAELIIILSPVSICGGTSVFKLFSNNAGLYDDVAVWPLITASASITINLNVSSNLREIKFEKIAYPLLFVPFVSRASEIIGKRIFIKLDDKEFKKNFTYFSSSNQERTCSVSFIKIKLSL